MQLFNILQLHMDVTFTTPRASNEEIQKAVALMKRVDLRDFSVCQFSNPGNYYSYITQYVFLLNYSYMKEAHSGHLGR